MELNIFNIEEVIFKNNALINNLKLKERYPEIFKEYSFLKSSGLHKSIINKLMKNFLEKLSNDSSLPFKIKSQRNKVYYCINFELSKKNYVNYISKDYYNINNFLITNNKHVSIDNNKLLNNIYKLYNNITITRNSNILNILFY